MEPLSDIQKKERIKSLTPEQYRVTQLKGTEAPGSGEYCHPGRDGQYVCVVCETPLFSSHAQYDSGSGWPSFYAALDPDKILETEDYSGGLRRIEVACKKCNAHLGHVFPDGPQPTGMRYCVNSASLRLMQ